MSAPKRLRARRYDTQTKLMRMRDLEPEDASWVRYPNSAWLAIESKAEAALMHQNIERQWEHVDGYELADFLNETIDSDWRRAPVREHAVRVNQLQRLRDQIDCGHWVVLGWTECNMVEWVEDAGVLGGGRWQLCWQWKSVENGSALVRHLNEVTQRRWRTSTPNRTPLSGEPFRAQFHAPKPGVLVADRSGSIWPTMGGSRARTDEDELTGASGRSDDWTSQSKTALALQSVANALDAIAGVGGRLPPGASPGMAPAGAAVRALARVVPGYVPSNAILSKVAGDGNDTPSPALSGDPYNPSNVDARVKPKYQTNPAHDTSNPLYNPRKTPEPSDARSAYENGAVRGGMGTWYAQGETGYYQYFSDNAGTVHFSGTIQASKVPASVLKIFRK
ncbi:hypothetical protein AAHK20_26445 [Trinickia sp. YCB016]